MNLYEQEIQECKLKYRELMDQGTYHLAKAKSLREKLEAIYIENMDFTVVEKHKQRIQNEIELISGEKA